MQGLRVRGLEPHELKPGEYGRWARDSDNWYARTPNGGLANLSAHTVTEHSDGTITASPSIAVSSGSGPAWHGFLERGFWRVC